MPLDIKPDSDKENKGLHKPPSLLNLLDDVVPSYRGFPLHTRNTRRNQIPVSSFRKLVFMEVLANSQIRLNPDVMNIIVLYTFERTHPFVPHEKIEYRRSLRRDRDILDLLTPCKLDDNTTSIEEDVIRPLIGRVLYGFDIHDSPYNTADDPNPCEIVTNDGSMFLVPDKMSDWFLHQDGKCVALPVLFRFKHCITDARVISRTNGPYLQLVISPVRGTLPNADDNYLYRKQGLDLESFYEDSDQGSLTSLDIDPSLLQCDLRTNTDDSLAAEIARSWKSKRESAFVFVDKSPTMVKDLSEELSDTVQDEEVDDRKSSNEYLTASECPIGRQQQKSASEAEVPYMNSFTTTGGLSYTSQGSVPLHSPPGELLLESETREAENANFPFRVEDKMKMRPSILTSDTKSSILELGAGFIGIHDLSLSFLHNIATPNPHCSRESSQECSELESIIV